MLATTTYRGKLESEWEKVTYIEKKRGFLTEDFIYIGTYKEKLNMFENHASKLL